MKRVLLLMIGAAVAVQLGTAASAATTSGRVVAADAGTHAITIETDAGTRLLFTRNDATKIEQPGADAAPGVLEVGSRITVTTDRAPTDPLVPMPATRVQLDEMAIATAATPGESAGDTVRVESAGRDGGQTIHTAQVESAGAQRTIERPSKTPLPLVAVLATGLLLAGLLLMLRRA